MKGKHAAASMTTAPRTRHGAGSELQVDRLLPTIPDAGDIATQCVPFGTGRGTVRATLDTAPAAIRITPEQALRPAVSWPLTFTSVLAEVRKDLTGKVLPAGEWLWLHNRVSPSGRVHLTAVCLIDGTPVSVARVLTTTPVPMWGALELETAPEHRGRGLAVKVLTEIMDWFPVDLGAQTYTSPAARGVAESVARSFPLVHPEILRMWALRHGGDTRPAVWPPNPVRATAGPGVHRFLQAAGFPGGAA